MRRFAWMSVVGLIVGVCAGCGGATDPQTPAAAAQTGKEPAPKSALPTASIPAKGDTAKTADEPSPYDAIEETEVQVEVPKEGTADWFVREATRLKLEPATKKARTKDGKEVDVPEDDIEKLRAYRRTRNEKIVSLSEQAIALTHDKKDQDRVFNLAVRNLLDARLQLALQGGADEIDALYKDAQALIDWDAKSPSAAEASFVLVSMAYNFARRAPQGEHDWIREFAKQAAFFAANYPKDEPRSAPLLFTAARSCELNGLIDEAMNSYSLITKSFPKSQYALRASTILRRLRLPGNSVQIAGPTLAGEQFALDDLLGKPALVVFWSSEAKPFETQLPAVQAAARKHAGSGLTIVGINLDSEIAAAKAFVETHKLAWPQIAFEDEERRGWNHPIANYYGVMEIPAYWLIDGNGMVISTSLTAEQLDGAIAAMLSGSTSDAPTKAAAAPEKTADR